MRTAGNLQTLQPSGTCIAAAKLVCKASVLEALGRGGARSPCYDSVASKEFDAINQWLLQCCVRRMASTLLRQGSARAKQCSAAAEMNSVHQVCLARTVTETFSRTQHAHTSE
jgi:hypothetical protein